MTDKERKKLIAELRDPSVYYVTGTCLAAAEEIERLAKENGRLTQALIDKLASYSAKDNAMTDSQRTKVTAAKRLEAIGLNDLTVAALLKELKENAMTKSEAEPQSVREIARDFARDIAENCERAIHRAADAQTDAEPPKEVRDAWHHYYHEAPVDFDPVAEEIFEAGWKAALAELAKENNFLQLQLNALRDLWDERDAALAQSDAEPPRPDASAGLLEAAEFTYRLLTLSFDRCEIDTCEIIELGEKLGLLEQAAYDPKIHKGEIDADEGDTIFVISAKGKSVRTRATDRSGNND